MGQWGTHMEHVCYLRLNPKVDILEAPTGLDTVQRHCAVCAP